MEKYPEALEFHSRLAGVIARQGRQDEAAAILEAALVTAPGEPSLQAALGVHRARQGNFAEATLLFQSAAESLPWAPGLRAMAVASQLSVPGAEGKAVQLGVGYLEAYPDDYAVAGLLGVVFAKLGAPEARQLLETGVKADQPEGEVAFLLGLAVMAEEDDERAGTLFAQELEHYPRNLEAAQAYISVLDRKQDYEGILKAASAALLHHPTDLPLLHAKAQALFNLKHFDVCRTELDLARAQYPAASSLMLLDANLLAKEDKQDEGAALFEKAKVAKEAEEAAGK
jgi:Flp pilus assembly protein TadD